MFSNASLVVGTDAAERDSLLSITDCANESFAVEDTIVGMVVADGDAMGSCEFFKTFFGLEGILCVSGFVCVNVG